MTQGITRHRITVPLHKLVNVAGSRLHVRDALLLMGSNRVPRLWSNVRGKRRDVDTMALRLSSRRNRRGPHAVEFEHADDLREIVGLILHRFGCGSGLFH